MRARLHHRLNRYEAFSVGWMGKTVAGEDRDYHEYERCWGGVGVGVG